MNIVKLIISIVVSFAAGALGSIATIPNIPTWYAALDKPWFSPPNWVFGPVWSLLYLMMGIALYLVWRTPSKQSKRVAFVVFGAQLALNALWSLVFFGLHQPWAAAIIIVCLFVMIALTIREFLKFSKVAVWLLLPYIAWVSFAAALNVAIALLN
jgi:translocator protein